METIYSRLRTWRWQLARELGVPTYFILSNSNLARVAAAHPTSVDELAKCRGMGSKKLAQFGLQLAELVTQCVSDGLESGVDWPDPTPEAAEPELRSASLSEEEVALIAAELRRQTAIRLVRSLKGRFSAEQVEEALRRLSTTA